MSIYQEFVHSQDEWLAHSYNVALHLGWTKLRFCIHSTYDNGNDVEVWLSAAKARELAAALIKGADELDRLRTK